jgi:hypothetical protein
MLVSVVSFAQEVDYSWTKAVTLQPGESADLVALSEPGFKDAWAEITGDLRVNGTKATYVSWCSNSTVKVTAESVVTIKLYGRDGIKCAEVDARNTAKAEAKRAKEADLQTKVDAMEKRLEVLEKSGEVK